MAEQELTFLRKCQECGHKQWDRDPTLLPNGPQYDNYLNRKCRKCKSEGSLDYGYRTSEKEEAERNDLTKDWGP